ncbi:SpoIIIAH-like family protein [Paenibacillus sp. FA6]|uniref:SpoIIIAH-like family protein n=1 Tax=Paenibacillus sp. FA6 TaxID=3413029 RepID=UPI003F657CEF
MNNKRQTIWLVSMLSLMVILSAYYLFTEDSGTSKIPVADSKQVLELQPVDNKELVITEVVTDGQVSNDLTATTKTPDVAIGSDTGLEEKEKTSEKATEETAKSSESKNDDEVLKEVASQAVSGRNILDSFQWERKESNIKKETDLYVKLDNQKSTPEELAKADNELKSLEEKESIITGIEEELHEQFGEVVVKEENDEYEVLVLADKLDVNQAVNIVELVMKELNVSQNKISVRNVKP